MSIDRAEVPAPANRASSIEERREVLLADRERLRDVLGKEHSLLEGILLHSPHGILVCDTDGQLVLQNEAARRIWAGSVSARNIDEWTQYRAFHPDGRPFHGDDWSMARCLRQHQSTDAEEIHFQRFDGTYGVMLGSSAPIFASDGSILGALSIFADITNFKELEQATEAAHNRAAFLASAGTTLLSSTLDLNGTLQRVTQLAVPAVADWCSIQIPDERLFSVAHVNPMKVALTHELARRYALRLGDPTGTADVLRTGEAALYEEVTEQMVEVAAQDDDHRELLRALMIRSAMIVPMSVRGVTIGTITLVSSNLRRRYRAEDLEMAQRLAQMATLAVENARLFRAEQQARIVIERAADRMTRLQKITADLAKALTSDGVAQVIVDHGAAAIGAANAAVWTYDTNAEHARLLRTWNFSELSIERLHHVEVRGPTAMAEAIRRREPVFIQSSSQYDSEYPVAAAQAREDGIPVTAFACLPLTVGLQVVGALALTFPEGRTLDDDDRVFLTLVAGHCAQSLYRARVYEAEQRTRFELSLLYELLDAIGRAETLEEVFEPALVAFERAVGVDRTSVMLFDPDGVLRFKAWHGLSETYRESVEGYCPWTTNMAAGQAQPIVMADVETDANAATLLPAFRAEGIRAGVTLPLVHQQKLLGKLMIYSDRTRTFSAEEVAMARSISAQVAQAVTRKQAEAEISRLFSQTEEARSVAETASRMKDEFLAVVSHELRTPMSAILGWCTMLGTERRNDPAAVGKGLDVIERNARAQMKIIEDILDVSRIITGKLKIEPRPISMSTLIGEALEVVRAPAAAKEISLHFVPTDDPHMIVGDPERVRQILWNLLSNAIKFTPRTGTVFISLEREGNAIAVSIRDSGKGIASEFLPYVFERFRQADSSTTRAQSGLGLGLAIVRHLIELHGGHVQAQSPGLGCGSTFTATFPVRALFSEAERRTDTGTFPILKRSGAPPSKGTSTLLAGRRVLVVDDERDARELLEEALGGHGAIVTTAGSVAAALAAVQASVPDVLVSDIGMPDEDGYMLIERIRKLDMTPRIAAIALTAYARSEERARALEAGYDEHLPKPTDPEKLTRLIAQLLR